MLPFKLTEPSKGHYLVEGNLTFAALNHKLSFDFLKTQKQITIDLIDVDLADSAGLALILEWIKQSKHYGTTLTINNIPHQLLTLAELTDLNINDYLRVD